MPQHKFDMTRAPPTPPDDGLTKAERLRRTATHPQMSWKDSVLDPKLITMTPPRPEGKVIKSRGNLT